MTDKLASTQAETHAQSSNETARNKDADGNNSDNAKDGARQPQPASSNQASNATPDA
jgi:hypothetical protein